jgi:hypothetical protein
MPESVSKRIRDIRLAGARELIDKKANYHKQPDLTRTL